MSIQLSHTSFLELPFMLNLPDGDYRIPSGETLTLNSSLFAGISNRHMASTVGVYGKLEEIKELCEIENLSIIKLRTTIKKTTTRRVPYIVEASDDAIIKEIKPELIIAGIEAKYLQATAQDRLYKMDIHEIKRARVKVSAKIIARKLFPHELAYQLLDDTNNLIEKYSTEFNDFFCQPVSIYDIASTNCGGIIQTTRLNNQVLESATFIEKFPAIAKRQWQNHTPDMIETFSSKLASGEPTDPVKLLIIRAKNLMEKRSYRSVIIESSAALETQLAKKIYDSLTQNGKTPEEAEKYLKEKTWFNERAKKGLKEVTGKSIPEINNALWGNVKKHRESIRNKVAHSNLEPSKQEAADALRDFEKMISLIQTM